MKLPDEQECFRLMDYYCLPQNIKEHCVLVAKVAKLIAQEHFEKGSNVNVHLVYYSSLLHDLAKPIEFFDYTELNSECEKIWKDLKKKYNNCRHPEAGYYILKDAYPEVARVIRKHDYMAIVSNDRKEKPVTSEEKIVNYADKRVSHGEIVSLRQRFNEGHRRWQKEANYNDWIAEKVDKKYMELEKELFFGISFEPHEIAGLID